MQQTVTSFISLLEEILPVVSSDADSKYRASGVKAVP